MRDWKFVALSVGAMLSGCSPAPAQTQACIDLQACVQAIRDYARAGTGGEGRAGPELDALKQATLAHEGAVDALLPLLRDPDLQVAGHAAYLLRDAPSIDPDYLPQIIEGLDRGLGWLPPALARIGTQEAAKEAVDRFLVSDSAPANQEAYALRLLGHRAIPFMLERARCDQACPGTHQLLAAVLRDMGPERAVAGPALIRLASNPDASPGVAEGALEMIAGLGSDGLALEADLLRIADEAPYLLPWVEQVLVAIRSRHAGRILGARLSSGQAAFVLRDLADVGAAGRDAGPQVMSILERDTRLRAAAAAALGYIGYDEAVPVLVDLLDDPVDITAVWAATRALGQLGADAALPALDRVAAGHWYGPVRDAAHEAASQVRTGRSEATGRADGRGRVDFFAFDGINRGLPRCERRHDIEPASSPDKLYHATAARELEQLKYPAIVLSYGASDAKAQREAGADIIEVNAGNLVEHRSAIEQTPHVALRVEDGWLVGGNRGEWGGELVSVGDDGRFQLVLEENVRDIHRVGNRIVATVGLAHLGLSRGAVMQLERDAGGQWRATPWRVLPGAPAESVASADGLVVSVVGGGAIRIAADGSMQMTDCPR